jgi:leader peptidase (prepilin peptidase) / N-methyltransferase
VLVVVCSVLGAVVGWLLPLLVARLPERPVPGDPAAGTVAELGAAGAAGSSGMPADDGPTTAAHPTAEPTYVLLAAWPPLRPVLAVATAAVFAALAGARGAAPDLPAFLVLGGIGVALAYVDLRRHRLPDALTGPAFAAGVVLLAGAAAAERDWSAYGRAWLGAVALGGIYLLLALLRPAGMGLGDVKLAAVLGLHLGWLGWGTVVVGGFLGFLLGGLVGVALLLARRVTLRSAVPFGPSMLLGALVATAWGEELVDAYLGR